MPIDVKPSPDKIHATLTLGKAVTELDAVGIDALIRTLAEIRATMQPVHPAKPPTDTAKLHQGDNLLWSVDALPERAAIQFATQHPGLGWTAMALSRAQVEDLITSFEFEAAKLPQSG